MTDDDLARQIEEVFSQNVGFPPDEWPALIALQQQIGRARAVEWLAQQARRTGDSGTVRRVESQLAYEQATATQMLLDIAAQIED